MSLLLHFARLRALWALCLFLGAFGAEAREVPELRARVTDEAGLLSAEQRARLETLLGSYQQKTGHQFALLTIPSLEGDVLEDFSIRAVQKWKLGDEKRDDGLLLLIAAQDRQMRIEVGYGLEGAIPDALASRVIRHQLTPAFREGRFAAGIEQAFDTLMKAAEGEAVRVGPEKTDEGGVDWFKLIPFAIFVLLLFSGRGGALPWLLLSGMGGGGRSGGGGGFGGFSGGGGGFGGGGASGRW